jgi:hypothetical protein
MSCKKIAPHPILRKPLSDQHLNSSIFCNVGTTCSGRVRFCSTFQRNPESIPEKSGKNLACRNTRRSRNANLNAIAVYQDFAATRKFIHVCAALVVSSEYQATPIFVSDAAVTHRYTRVVQPQMIVFSAADVEIAGFG